jgi:hypothetical protein
VGGNGWARERSRAGEADSATDPASTGLARLGGPRRGAGIRPLCGAGVLGRARVRPLGHRCGDTGENHSERESEMEERSSDHWLSLLIGRDVLRPQEPAAPRRYSIRRSETTGRAGGDEPVADPGPSLNALGDLHGTWWRPAVAQRTAGATWFIADDAASPPIAPASIPRRSCRLRNMLNSRAKSVPWFAPPVARPR